MAVDSNHWSNEKLLLAQQCSPIYTLERSERCEDVLGRVQRSGDSRITPTARGSVVRALTAGATRTPGKHY
jgi:hypothetical protein